MHSKAHRRALASMAALITAPVAMSQEAPAQKAEAEEIGEIVVSGYRASLQSALEVKRSSELVVDAISGGDIGALPDVTIAESLVRLPGVNGTRDRGNQSQATLRGLGPRLVLGLVNGREVASSEPNRNVRWEIYPSEVVSGADVYKSQSADIVAGGVAGTIDIKTIQPLNYTGPEILLRGGPVYYEAGADIPGYDPYGYRGSASFTHSVGDNFAFNLGASAQRQKNAFPSFQGWGYNDESMHSTDATGDIDGDGEIDPTPWGAQTEVKKLTEDRYGVNAAIGWRPTDSFELNVDALYSKFTIDEDQNQAWYGRNFWGNWDNGQAWCYDGAQSSYTVENGSVVGATLDNCFAPVTNVIAKYTEDKDLLVTGVNGKFETESWTVSGDLSYSDAQRTNRWAAFMSEVWPATMTYDMSAGVRPSVTTSSDPSDPMIQAAPNWLPGQSDGPDDLTDELSAVRFDATRRFEGAVKALQFGVRFSEREKDYTRREADFIGTAAGPLPASLFSSFSVKEFDAPPLLNGDFDEIVDYVYGGMPASASAVVPTSGWNVEESVSEAYAMLRFGGTMGSPFTGNAGVRFVRTETTSSGFQSFNGGAAQPLSYDNDYTEALPSLNLTFNLTDSNLLRFGAARVIARPPLDELRASRTLWNQAQPFTGQAGNALLDPFLATQFDVSYEFYFGPEALFAMAAFYKDVETHIGYTTVPEVIGGDTYQVTQPNNGDGGDIAGMELTFQTPFAREGALRNFGIYTNYAFVDTDVSEFYPVTDPLPIEGYAKHTAVIDLWFQKSGIEARLGWKYHSPFSIIAGWNGSDVRSLGTERILDFSTSWQVNEMFGMRLQLSNLTDEPLRITRDNNTSRLGSFDVYGRRALLDFTFKF
ncbi:MAG TPA: TonB-dependent receptor [Steroidobacteraceae bacterium]|nr:TonB-dependent receptor [Steroidobacteraceae bacterium]